MVHGIHLFLLLSSYICTNIYACNEAERSSLLSFASTLSSPLQLNWTSVHCCHWKCITCNEDGRVTHLLLPSERLKGGNFTSSLKNLTHLTHLNLSHNSLYGSLETQFFSSLNRLEVLDLSYNMLSGDLPLSLPSRNIRAIDLSSNQFHGSIPTLFFREAWNLTSFNVSNNTFSGSIPSSICLHSSPLIRLLDFSYNDFNGSISHGPGKCSKLQVFRAGYNNFSGLFPQDICNAAKLEEISLPSNSLYGAISERIANLTNLAVLDLSFNQFSGVLPLHFGKVSKLKLLTLDSNYLQGPLPSSLMNCTNLVELHIASNHLAGDISKLDFSKLGQLSKLDLIGNNFTGALPMSLYSCSSLKALRLSGNRLEGQIQPEIRSLKSLSFLSLGLNRLTNITGAMKILTGCKSLHTLFLPYSFEGEELPADDGTIDFGGFINLRSLNIGECDLTGQVPEWISKLKNMEMLFLGKNRMTGPIPSWLGTLPKLFYLSLEGNQLTGEIPKELCRLPRLLKEPSASQLDHYDFELPFLYIVKYKVYSPRHMFNIPPSIKLGDNNLTGTIPADIGQLRLLHSLYLQGNKFSGGIPDQISNLKNLETLDLSRNNFSGNIPSSLSSLTFLKECNVSCNDLEGAIPTGTQLQSLDASSFGGNPKLCGDPLPNKCQSTKGGDEDNKKNQDDENEQELPWFYISVALGFIVGFWGVCGSLIIKKTWRYAYFRLVKNVKDRIGLMIAVRIDRIKRKLRG